MAGMVEMDPWVEQGHRDLVASCRAYLRWQDSQDGPWECAQGHYRPSLAPAAAWGAVRGGGEPDRRYGLAVSEADLHRAMMALPPLLFAVARLSRTEQKTPGWARRWDTALGVCAGMAWLSHRDDHLFGSTRTRAIALSRIVTDLVDAAAEHMAGTLGPSWLHE